MRDEGGTRTHEGILDEREGVVGDLGNELDALRLGGVVDASLEDTASVTVSAAEVVSRGQGKQE